MNKKEFISSLNECKVDKHITINFMDDFGVADKFGGRHVNHTADKMLTTLRSLGAHVGEVSYVNGEWVEGEDIKVVDEPVIEEKEETPVEVTEVVEEVEPESDEAVSETIPEVDWGWVSTLKNNTPSKKELDKYAKEKFNLDLNRRMTLENMIVDFKTQLGIEA